MSKRYAEIGLTCLLLVTLSSESSAQNRVCADQPSAGTPCCGHYECMADHVLPPIEAQADFRQRSLADHQQERTFLHPLLEGLDRPIHELSSRRVTKEARHDRSSAVSDCNCRARPVLSLIPRCRARDVGTRHG